MALLADNRVNRNDGADKDMNIKFFIGSLFRLAAVGTLSPP